MQDVGEHGAPAAGRRLQDRVVNNPAKELPSITSATFTASRLPAHFFAGLLELLIFFRAPLFQQRISSYSSSKAYFRKPKKYYFSDRHAPNIDHISLFLTSPPVVFLSLMCSTGRYSLISQHRQAGCLGLGMWNRRQRSTLKKLTM